MTLIKPQSAEKLKETWIKVLLSRTDGVTKVTDGSVLNGVAYADAKLGQKALKDVALAQSHFYPDSAHGQYLDNIAAIYGISARFGALGSSTYVRINALSGTAYLAATHKFQGSNGIIWDLDADTTVGADGFTYAKVTSQTTGANTAIALGEISKVAPIPVGHLNVVNEYLASGGRDAESDIDFRQRIKEAINALARPTRSYLKQAMLKFQTNVLRVFNYGDNGLGQTKLAIATVDGSDLSAGELTTLTANITPWLSLAEEQPDGLSGVGVELVNVEWEPIDISFRADVIATYNADDVRANAQVRINKYLDYRTWVGGDNVEWDDLLQIVKTTEGIRYVPDQYFYPNADLSTNILKLPRIRGFQMLDLNGNIISNGSGTLNPVYYPTEADFSLISTVLANL